MLVSSIEFKTSLFKLFQHLLTHQPTMTMAMAMGREKRRCVGRWDEVN